MARPCGPPPAGGRERIRMVGHERPCRAGGVRLAGRCHAKPRRGQLDRRSSAPDRRFTPGVTPGATPGVRRAGAAGGCAHPARDAPAAAVREVGRGASRRGGTLARMARWRGSDARGRGRGVRAPALRHGLVGRHRPEPLRPPGGGGVPGRGVAARGLAGRRRNGREAGIAQGGDRSLRLHRTGQPVARHGRGPLRERTGDAGDARPVRRRARARARRLAPRRDVRPPRRRGRPGRSAVEAAGDLRARMRPRGAVVESRHPAGRGARPQPGRNRGGAHRGGVQPGGRPASRGGAGRARRRVARRGRDGGGVRTGLARRGCAERSQFGLAGRGSVHRRGQRGAPGHQRPGGGDCRDPRASGGGRHPGRAGCARAPPTTAP